MFTILVSWDCVFSPRHVFRIRIRYQNLEVLVIFVGQQCVFIVSLWVSSVHYCFCVNLPCWQAYGFGELVAQG